SSSIAWQPVIEGSRVFIVRQTGFPPEPNSDESPVVCMNLDTGQELWFRHIPWLTGDWTTWIAGVANGKVFVSRSGNGASVKAKVHALDAATGATLWSSVDLIDAGPYDGVVFAPNGDPVVASFTKIWRLNAATGTTVWTANRVGSVSGNCGGAIYGNAIYVADAVVGGHAIKKFNLTTGAFMYQSPTLAGFTIQNTPMVAPDGTIYLSRVQNNASVDFFYAIDDNGASMSVRWSVPAHWTTESEFAVASDGSVFMMDPGNKIARRRASDGSLMSSTAAIPADFSQPRMAVDAQDRLYFSNGAFANGRFYSFNPDLTERWSVAVTNINIGAPAFGRDGTLLVAGTGTNIKAYRTTRCPADFNHDGFVNGDDYDAFAEVFDAADPAADLNHDGFVNGDDYDLFAEHFDAGC
ncbi:MAG: PQQ-binding-like beta-propeller repeat protein, partial [Phycisphaerae bacterium]|nr:PQQ-binding-like beta-propeller repeat protein [Phycisphaerae bacterium]